jgi:hypothetical protein
MNHINFDENGFKFEGWKNFYNLIAPFETKERQYIARKMEQRKKKSQKTLRFTSLIAKSGNGSKLKAGNLKPAGITHSKSFHPNIKSTKQKLEDKKKKEADNNMKKSRVLKEIKNKIEELTLIKQNCINPLTVNAHNYEIVKFLMRNKQILKPILQEKAQRFTSYIDNFSQNIKNTIIQSYQHHEPHPIMALNFSFYNQKSKLLNILISFL